MSNNINVISLSIGHISLIPYKEEHNVAYYKLISHRINGRLLKRKYISIATIRKTPRDYSISFEPVKSMQADTIKLVNAMVMDISQWNIWYNFKRNRWYGIHVSAEAKLA